MAKTYAVAYSTHQNIALWFAAVLVGRTFLVACSEVDSNADSLKNLGGAPAQGGSVGSAPVALGGAGGATTVPKAPLSVTDTTCGFSGNLSGAKIVIENLAPGEVVPHQMVRLVGRLTKPVSRIDLVHGETHATIQASTTEFVAFAVLEPGLNYVGFKADGHAPLCFPVEFREPTNDHQVRYFSFTSSNSQPDRFLYHKNFTDVHRANDEYACLDDDPCDARTIADRMRFMALIDQMLFAEILVGRGAPRHTFTLARDADGKVVDPLFLSNRTAEQLVADATAGGKTQGSDAVMGQAMIEIRAQEIAAGLDPKLIKHVMIFRDVGAGSWGGGNAASMGAGTFFTWASDINQFYERIYDERDAAAAGAYVDEGGGQVGQRYVGSMGTFLHEFGHTLGLRHPEDYTPPYSPPCKEIMAHGYGAMGSFIFPDKDESAVCWAPGDGVDPRYDHQTRVLENVWIKGVN